MSWSVRPAEEPPIRLNLEWGRVLFNFIAILLFFSGHHTIWYSRNWKVYMYRVLYTYQMIVTFSPKAKERKKSSTSIFQQCSLCTAQLQPMADFNGNKCWSHGCGVIVSLWLPSVVTVWLWRSLSLHVMIPWSLWPSSSTSTPQTPHSEDYPHWWQWGRGAEWIWGTAFTFIVLPVCLKAHHWISIT